MNASQITIVQASVQDADDVRAILQEAADWLVAQGLPLWKDDDLRPETIRDEVAQGAFWLAKADGEAAGCVRFQLEDRLFWPDVPPGEAAYIHRLAVRRSFAGGGVSGALIEWAKHRTRYEGRSYLRLDCEADRPRLRDLYESKGFRVHSEKQVGPYRVARFEIAVEGLKE